MAAPDLALTNAMRATSCAGASLSAFAAPSRGSNSPYANASAAPTTAAAASAPVKALGPSFSSSNAPGAPAEVALTRVARRGGAARLATTRTRGIASMATTRVATRARAKRRAGNAGMAFGAKEDPGATRLAVARTGVTRAVVAAGAAREASIALVTPVVPASLGVWWFAERGSGREATRRATVGGSGGPERI